MKSWLSRNDIRFCSTSFIFFICIGFATVLQGMQEVVISPHGLMVLHTVVQNELKFFRHQQIYTLAATNKSCRNLMLNSAESRKHYFFELQPHLKSLDNLVWNMYGTACALATCGSKLNWSLCEGSRTNRPCGVIKELLIERRFIFTPNFISDYCAWQSFCQELPHKPRVSFNGTKGLYIHVYGGMGGDTSGNVLEYRLLSYGEHDALTCVTEIMGKRIPLHTFLEFPSLLEAFLHSTVVKRTASVKVFMLEGMTVPKNYRDCQQYFPQPIYDSFDDLSKKIRKEIDALYNQQNKVVVKKKQKMSCFG